MKGKTLLQKRIYFLSVIVCVTSACNPSKLFRISHGGNDENSNAAKANEPETHAQKTHMPKDLTQYWRKQPPQSRARSNGHRSQVLCQA
jgi:hypothetical protein